MDKQLEIEKKKDLREKKRLVKESEQREKATKRRKTSGKPKKIQKKRKISNETEDEDSNANLEVVDEADPLPPRPKISKGITNKKGAVLVHKASSDITATVEDGNSKEVEAGDFVVVQYKIDDGTEVRKYVASI